MNQQIQQVGALPDGNLLVALHPTVFDNFTKLLNYYRDNEERKRKEKIEGTPSNEIWSIADFAEYAKVKPDTVRRWCKDWLKPALVDPNARHKRLDKAIAIQLYKGGQPKEEIETRVRYTQR